MMSTEECLTYLRRSFGLKLILVFIVLAILLQGATSLWIVAREDRAAKEDIINRGSMLTDTLAYSARNGIFSENNEMLQSVAEGVLRQGEVGAVFIHNMDARRLFKQQKKAVYAYKSLLEGESSAAIRSKLTTAQSTEIVETLYSFEFIKPVVMKFLPDNESAIFFGQGGDEEKIEKVMGYVTIVMDKSILKRRMTSSIVSTGLMALAVIFVGVILISLIIRRVTVPLDKLSQEVRKLGKGEKINRVSIDSQDEIGRLAESFNTMLEDLTMKETQTRKLEEHLSNSRKMEAVGTLARGISHDFNNILGTIEGSVYMLQKKLENDNLLQKYPQRIHNSISKARGLIDSLLTFSQGQKLQLVPVDINTIIRESIDVMMAKYEDRVEISSELSDRKLMVIASSIQLSQVFSNIISNACDAMPLGGRITIVTGERAVVEDAQGNLHHNIPAAHYAFVSVADTGEGIPEEIKDKIFEPFFTTKEVGKGTGLGLSIVYGIVTELNGHIYVESIPSKGTIFFIYIPLISNSDLQPDTEETIA